MTSPLAKPVNVNQSVTAGSVDTKLVVEAGGVDVQVLVVILDKTGGPTSVTLAKIGHTIDNKLNKTTVRRSPENPLKRFISDHSAADPPADSRKTCEI
jgi:hypothetical protein